MTWMGLHLVTLWHTGKKRFLQLMDQQIWNVWELKMLAMSKVVGRWTAKKGLWELLTANLKYFTQVVLFSTSPTGKILSAAVTLPHKNLPVIPLLCKNLLVMESLSSIYWRKKVSAGFVSAWQMSTTGRRVFQGIPVKEEAFVFCPNLERMAFHWDLPQVPLNMTCASSSRGFCILCLLFGKMPCGTYAVDVWFRWLCLHSALCTLRAWVCCKTHQSDGTQANFSENFNSEASGILSKHNLLDRN